MSVKEKPEKTRRIGLDDYASMVGCKVVKYSGKPFKSKSLINTIKSMGELHPVTGRKTFLFVEDEAYVECFRCGKIE